MSLLATGFRAFAMLSSLLVAIGFARAQSTPTAEPFVRVTQARTSGDGALRDETSYGLGNYTGDEHESGSEFVWLIDGISHRVGTVRSLFAMESASHPDLIDDSANHDGTVPTANCSEFMEGRCSVDLGLDYDKSETYNDAEYVVKLVAAHGAPLDLTAYEHLLFWIYVADPLQLRERHAFRLFLTSNDPWWLAGYQWRWDRVDLQPGWNFLTARMSLPDVDNCGINPGACDFDALRFLVFTFYPSGADFDITHGDLKIDEVKVSTESVAVSRAALRQGDQIEFSYRPCDQTDCGEWQTTAPRTISNAPPVVVGEPHVVAQQFASGSAVCELLDRGFNLSYYDADGDAQTGSRIRWYLNQFLVDGRDEATLSLSAVDAEAGDTVHCEVRYENARGSTEWTASNLASVLPDPVIAIDAAEKVQPIRRGLFGQGVEMNPRAMDRAVSWDVASHSSIESQIRVAREMGITDVRFGGGSANSFCWDRCKSWHEGSTYYRISRGGYVLEDCAGHAGIRGVYDYVEAIGASGSVLAINMINDCEENLPDSVRTDPAYSADFVRYINGDLGLGVTHWEMGNENYLPNGLGWDRDATTYATMAMAHCQAMKDADSTVQCGLVLAPAMSMVDVNGNNWNEEVLTVAGAHADFLVNHHYEGSQIPTTRYASGGKTTWQDWTSSDGDYSVRIRAMSEYDSIMKIYIDDQLAGTFVVDNYAAHGAEGYVEFVTQPVPSTRGPHRFTVEALPGEGQSVTQLILADLGYRIDTAGGSISRSLPIVDPEYTLNSALTSDVQIGAYQRAVDELARSLVGHTLPMFVTEHLCHPSTRTYPGWGRPDTRYWACDGPSNALRYQQFMRDGVEKAHVWLSLGGGWPSVYYNPGTGIRKPQFFVHQMFSRNTGDSLVRVDTREMPAFSHWSFREIPYLSVTASTDDASLFVNVVNRHQSQDLPASLHISGFDYAAIGRLHWLTAPALDSNNEDKEQIFTRSQLVSGEAMLHHRFERYGIYTIRLYRDDSRLQLAREAPSALVRDAEVLENEIPIWVSDQSSESHIAIESELGVDGELPVGIAVAGCDISAISYSSSFQAYERDYTGDAYTCTGGWLELTLPGVEVSVLDHTNEIQIARQGSGNSEPDDPGVVVSSTPVGCGCAGQTTSTWLAAALVMVGWRVSRSRRSRWRARS